MKEKVTAREIFTIPNILSYIRILLIPVFIISYLRAESQNEYYLAALILFVSGFTDLADGWIARHFNQITRLGKTVDPIADKLTQAAVAICLALRIKGMIFILVLHLIKEGFMAINNIILIRSGKGPLDGAMWFGKLSTAAFYLLMTVAVAVPTLPAMWMNVLMGATAFFMIVALIMYIPVFRDLRKGMPQDH